MGSKWARLFRKVLSSSSPSTSVEGWDSQMSGMTQIVSTSTATATIFAIKKNRGQVGKLYIHTYPRIIEKLSL